MEFPKKPRVISFMRGKIFSRVREIWGEARPRVLVAGELGGGFGHTHRLLAVTDRLVDKGLDAMFAVRNDADTADVMRKFPRASVIPLPRLRRSALNAPGGTYADLLLGCGYHSPDTLEEGVREWRRIFKVENPAVIVCDHSPTVVLAASGLVPVIHIGSGFATPPAGRPLLVLRRAGEAGAAEREARVLYAIGKVQHSIGIPEISGIHELFSHARNFACCLPELDPYRSVRQELAAGPVHQLPRPEPLPPVPFLFGYLTGLDVRVPGLVASLVKAQVPAGIFIRQMDPVCADLVQGSKVQLYYTPQEMHAALARASAVLHHGGLSTTGSALAMGRPQFLLPRHLEQSLAAETIERMGCGVNLRRERGEIGCLIKDAIEKDTYAKKAATAAAGLTNRTHRDVAEEIAAVCFKHIVTRNRGTATGEP